MDAWFVPCDTCYDSCKIFVEGEEDNDGDAPTATRTASSDALSAAAAAHALFFCYKSIIG